jgi:DNA-binding response OmpR family regulator/nitrogen-specific signal transduction histidine kinase
MWRSAIAGRFTLMSHVNSELPIEPVETSSELDTRLLFSSVLLVEDEPAHAALIKRALMPFVGDIDVVSSGQAALRMIESQFTELVLCDLHLPDMPGLEVIQTIRRALPLMPIVVLTSSANIDDAVSAMREGAWEYMVKQTSGDLSERIRLVVQRVAERKSQLNREMKLRGERDAFWAAVHAASDGLAIVGGEGSVVFASEAFRRFCKAVAGEEIELPINVLDVVGRRDEGVSTALRKHLSERSQESIWTTEVKVIDLEKGDPEKHGAELVFEITLSAVSLDSRLQSLDSKQLGLPNLHHHVMWVRDITRKKEQERFQRDLLSTTSHDLKGPLGAILTSAELLGESDKLNQSTVNDLVIRIASCARNSINIIDELLSARRIQDGVLVINPRWYDVAEILEDTVLDYLPLAKAKSIQFSYKTPDEELKVWADRIGLNRILGNLVGNAIKFTPKEGRVHLEAKKDGEAARISIEDSGPGIGPKERHQLFERYSRLEKHKEIEGTGLGLFVTKNIVEAHNGRIELESEVGKGSKFSIIFPNPPPDSQ